MKIRLGETSEGVEVLLDVESMFKERLLIQGISGSQKSATVDGIMKHLKLYYKTDEIDDLPQIIFDWEGERTETYPNFGKYLIIGSGISETSNLTIENAYYWGKEIREKKLSVIIDLSTFKSIEERETVVSEFINAIIDVDKEFWTQCVVVIDESHNLCKQSGKCESRDAVIRLCETGRKRGIATILLTQRLSQLNKNASAQMANRIIGRTIELPDRERAMKLLGMKVSENKVLADMVAGEFIAFGNAISIEPVQFTVDHKTEKELQGFITKPQEHMANIESMIASQQAESPTNRTELVKIKIHLTELANSVQSSEIVGYSKAMYNVRNVIEKNKSSSGFWKTEKELEFTSRTYNGIEILDLVGGEIENVIA